LKNILSVGAALAALAFTTSIGFAQTAPTPMAKVVAPKATHKKAKANEPNSGAPGSNGFSGSGQLPAKNKKKKMSAPKPAST
jgi:hypothetical protein